MVYKLNSEAPESIERCNLTDETSDENIVLDIEDKRAQVANYRTVMTDNFRVPVDRFFNAIPVNVDHLRSFIDKNGGSDFKACRIYITKDSADPTGTDYELLFVPCEPVNDPQGQLAFFRDNLGELTASHTFSAKCKRPPGCGQGALLL